MHAVMSISAQKIDKRKKVYYTYTAAADTDRGIMTAP